MEKTPTVTRYISETRARGVDWSRQGWPNPPVAQIGDAVGWFYDVTHNRFTEYVLVADDDPRAETYEER